MNAATWQVVKQRISLPQRGPQTLWAVCTSLLLIMPGAALAQRRPQLPAPQTLDLVTRDGVHLHATYFASPLEKEAVPVILLHGQGGQGSDYRDFPNYLQGRLRCAVLLPDLRGHGSSTQVEFGGGVTREVTADQMRPGDYAGMVTEDMEALKRFLLEEHNEGRLNIDKICVVAADLGAIVALNWAARDWSFPALATYKQGRDVKGVALLSPSFNYRGFGLKDALAHPAIRNEISISVIYGKGDSRARRDANRIIRILESARRGGVARASRARSQVSRDVEASSADDDDDSAASEEATFDEFTQLELDSSDQGTALLTSGATKSQVGKSLTTFIEQIQRLNIPWQERKNPLE